MYVRRYSGSKSLLIATGYIKPNIDMSKQTLGHVHLGVWSGEPQTIYVSCLCAAGLLVMKFLLCKGARG